MKEKRALGGSESYYHYIAQAHEAHNNICSFALFDLKNFDLDRLEQAVEVTVKSQPMLRSRIVEENDFYYFEVDDIVTDIPIVSIEKDNINDIPSFIEKQLCLPFAINDYQWRAYIFFSNKHDKKAIILTISHAISDGFSSMYFYDSIFRAYEGGELPLFSLEKPISKPCSVKMVKPEDFVAGQTTGLPDAFEPTKIPALHEVPLEKRFTRCKYHHYSELDSVKAEAHHYGVTLNAFICAAAIIAMAKTFDDTISLSVVTPLDLRRRCQDKVPQNYIGLYMGLNDTYHQNISPLSRIEEVAEHYQNQSVKMGHHLGYVYEGGLSIKEIGKLHAKFRPDEHLIPLSLMVSNLGELPISGQYKEIVWQSYYRTLTIRRRVVPLKLAIHTFQHKLMVTYMHADQVLTSGFLKRYIKHFETLLSLSA